MHNTSITANPIDTETAKALQAAIHHQCAKPVQSYDAQNHLQASWIATPLGNMLAIADSQSLHLLEFFNRLGLSGEIDKLQKTTRANITFGPNAILDQLKHDLDRYFSGQSPQFQIPLTMHGRPFTQQVWQALQTIPAGQTRSYKELAAQVGKPRGTQAVGQCNGKNQIALVIPCHRVIGTDGSLTGYAGGLWRKEWLITHEKRHFS